VLETKSTDRQRYEWIRKYEESKRIHEKGIIGWIDNIE